MSKVECPKGWIPVVAIGSNLSDERLGNRVHFVKDGFVTIPDRKLTLDKIGTPPDTSGKATLAVAPGKTAYGVVHWMSPASVADLDRVETGYHRETITVFREDGTQMQALVYSADEDQIQAPERIKDLKIRPWYGEHMWRGALGNLPPEGVEAVVAAIPLDRLEEDPKPDRTQEQLKIYETVDHTKP